MPCRARIARPRALGQSARNEAPWPSLASPRGRSQAVSGESLSPQSSYADINKQSQRDEAFCVFHPTLDAAEMCPGANYIHDTQTFDVGLFHLRCVGLDRFD